MLEKISLLKGLGEFNSQVNSLNSCSLYGNSGKCLSSTQITEDEINHGFTVCLGLQELQKRNSMMQSLGMPQFNGLQGKSDRQENGIASSALIRLFSFLKKKTQIFSINPLTTTEFHN